MWFDVNALNLTTICENFGEFVKKFYDRIAESDSVNFVFSTSSSLNSSSLPVGRHFTDFQTDLLKILLILVTVNCLLIGFYWHQYGTIITDKFIRPSTTKEIEELKLSVARLKLPKDYTPRI